MNCLGVSTAVINSRIKSKGKKEFIPPHSSSPSEVKTGVQDRNLELADAQAKEECCLLYWLVPHSLLSLLSYIASRTTKSGVELPTSELGPSI